MVLYTANYLNTKSNFINYKAFCYQNNVIKYFKIPLYGFSL